MNRLTHIVQTETGRYVVVGVSVYLFEVAVLLTSGWLGASSLVSVSLSFWLGLILSFFLQKLVTFQDKRLHKKIVAFQFIAACVLVLWNFFITLIITKLFQNILPAVITRTLALGLTTVWNFYIYKTRIFKGTDVGPLVS